MERWKRGVIHELSVRATAYLLQRELRKMVERLEGIIANVSILDVPREVRMRIIRNLEDARELLTIAIRALREIEVEERIRARREMLEEPLEAELRSPEEEEEEGLSPWWEYR